MHAQEQYVLLFAEPQHLRAKERSCRQIEDPGRFFGEIPSHRSVALAFLQLREVLHREREIPEGRDHVHGSAIHLFERRAQHVVPADDFPERTRQRLDAQRTHDLPRDRKIVGGAPRTQTIQEPQALLREGEDGRLRFSASGNDLRARDLQTCLLKFSKELSVDRHTTPDRMAQIYPQPAWAGVQHREREREGTTGRPRPSSSGDSTDACRSRHVRCTRSTPPWAPACQPDSSLTAVPCLRARWSTALLRSSPRRKP